MMETDLLQLKRNISNFMNWSKTYFPYSDPFPPTYLTDASKDFQQSKDHRRFNAACSKDTIDREEESIQFNINYLDLELCIPPAIRLPSSQAFHFKTSNLDENRNQRPLIFLVIAESL